MTDTYADIERCVNHWDFLRRFYRTLTGSHPEIAVRFRETDWAHRFSPAYRDQRVDSLCLGRRTGRRRARALARFASHQGYDTARWVYDHWLEALIPSLSETDPQWSQQLDRRWREAMGKPIDEISTDAPDPGRRRRPR